MNDAVLAAAGEVLGELVGLRSTAATDARLSASIAERAAALGLDPARYVGRIRADGGERQELLELVTVPETSFFREPAQFAALARRVLPAIRGPVIAWSAGCSSGQEPYSMAITLDELGVPEWRVIATDVSVRAVERTNEGSYRESELRGLSPARRGRYLRRHGNRWQVVDELRARVRAVHANVAADDAPVPDGACSVALCRNVFIYLRRDSIAAAVDRIAGALAPGGFLFLGVSEALWRHDERFRLARVDDAFGYRREPRQVEPPTPVRCTLEGPAAPPVERPAGSDPRRRGEVAARQGRHHAAVSAFRQAVYLDPDDPLAHVQLGLCLEAAGDAEAGRRAFLAARAALGRSDRRMVEERLEGYSVEALEAVLAAKLGAEPCL